MIKINLFKKEGVYTNLLIGTLEQGKTNMPLYNESFTLWKGVDNTLEFSIRNHDRKSIEMSDGILTFTMINQTTRQTYIKELETIDSALGKYKVVITKKELNDYDCGSFVGHVSVSKDGTEELLYTGTDWYPFFTINIEPNKLEVFSETKVIKFGEMLKEVYDDKDDGTLEVFSSSAIKSDITPYHTFIMKLKEFCGEIIIQGSLMDIPQSSDDWFDITVFEHKPPKEEDTEDTENTEDTEDTEDTENTENTEDTEDTEDTENTENTEDTENTENTENTEDTENTEEEFIPLTDTILLSSILNCLWVRVLFKRTIGSDSIIEEFEYRN